MKEVTNKVKIATIVIIAIIVIGIVMLYTKGLNFDVAYAQSTKIAITLDDMNLEDIKNKAEEIFGKNDINVQTVGDFNEEIIITVTNMQDEELTNFKNELTNLNNGEEKTITTTNVGVVQPLDLIKPYISPVVIATVIMSVYMAIRYRKDGVLKQLLTPILSVTILEFLFLSIIAIVRIPIGIYIMPTATLIYIITMIYVIQKNSKVKEEEK